MMLGGGRVGNDGPFCSWFGGFRQGEGVSEGSRLVLHQRLGLSYGFRLPFRVRYALQVVDRLDRWV